MSVLVKVSRTETETVEKGTKFYVDARGTLVVTDDAKREIAAYPVDRWLNAKLSD